MIEARRTGAGAFVMAETENAFGWDDLRLFLATARHGSVRAAAAALGVSHSTVARRIDRFERQLGSRLFDRTAGGYAITETGRGLRRQAEAMEAIALDVERRVVGEDRRLAGSVRVTMPLSAAHDDVLMPDLAAFARRYPEVELRVRAADAPLDLSRREADVAVRFVPIGTPPPTHLIGRHVGRSCNAAYARADYLDAHPIDAVDAGARWLGWGDDVARPDWVDETGLPAFDARHGFDDPLLQLSAARQGLGVAFVPCCLGDVDPALVRVPGSRPVPRFDIWILSHPDLRDTARLRAVRDHLAAALEAKAARFEGVAEGDRGDGATHRDALDRQGRRGAAR